MNTKKKENGFTVLNWLSTNILTEKNKKTVCMKTGSKELGRKKREKVAMTILIGALITIIIAIIKF